MRIALAVLFAAVGLLRATEPVSPAALAINSLGLDLLRKTSRPTENALLSPYSIQNALAMTYAGADGQTREEMARALHYPTNEAELHKSFALLNAFEHRGVTLEIANRLFGQSGYEFRAPFLALAATNYGAPLAQLDFKKDADGSAHKINVWVEGKTHDRIRDLIPSGALGQLSRLVLVNAIYFKGAWEKEFVEGATNPELFHVPGAEDQKVQTMLRLDSFGYQKGTGYQAVSLHYKDSSLQFLILLPEEKNGLSALEAQLTPQLLKNFSNLKGQQMILHLPKFKLEPPSLDVSPPLKELGMLTAFDVPRGSANFDRMAPRRPDDYLSISAVIHKTFIAVDEKGTEAAAATAVVMVGKSASDPLEKPLEVKVDRPFVFAIQETTSGACLFLGHVTDPR